MSKEFCLLCAFASDVFRTQLCVLCNKEEPIYVNFDEPCPYYDETEFWTMEDKVRNMTIDDIINYGKVRVPRGDMLKLIPPISTIPLCVECSDEYVKDEGGLCNNCAKDILLNISLTKA